MARHKATTEIRSKISPLLIQGAVERIGSDDIPGSYCAELHMWVVDGFPIVEARSEIAELTTKTEAKIERDDSGEFSLLEMQTKTLSQIERDDQDFGIGLLELATNTVNKPERDA